MIPNPQTTLYHIRLPCHSRQPIVKRICACNRIPPIDNFKLIAKKLLDIKER